MTENQEKKAINRAVLVGLNAHCLSREESADDSSMEELADLLETAGGECVGTVFQNKDTPDPRTFIGEGKVAEVKELVDAMGADMVIVDNPLSPSQQRALSEDLKVQVLDRAALILDIFAQRARTKEGRLQVELAQYQYLLPRLLGMWTHLERQEGAIGTRGPGETQLETDRRHIRRKIQKLREELDQVRRVRATQRSRREKNEVPVVAIVGYTNAGKSTLLNKLTGADIPANNRLFDTLDTTTRTLEISDTCTVLLSDTVGFIRKLPHHLVEAFKATLEELSQRYGRLHPQAAPPSGGGLQGHPGGAVLRRPAAPRHRHLQPGVAGAGRGGGEADLRAGGGADSPHRRVQQDRPLPQRDFASRGGHCVHLRQNRPGAGRAAE